MNVHLNPFFIWSSYSFQTEIPELLDLENKQPSLRPFVKSNTSQVFILSSEFRCILTYNNMVKMSIRFYHVYYSYLVVRWGRATLS